MRLRTAEDDDLASILEIYNHAVRTTTAVYTEEEVTLENRRAWLRARQELGYPVLVASDENDDAPARIVGFASFGEFRPWPGFRYTVEHSVYVRDDARGQGIGALLVSALLEEAKALGKHVMVAGIDAANPASIRLHEKLGFEKTGLMHAVGFKFGRWLDLQWMQKTL